MAQFWVILGHFAPNLRIDFQKCSQKVPKNDENSMKIFFWAKNILNSSQINLEHLIIRRNAYIRYIRKFSYFWCTFPDYAPVSAFVTIYIYEGDMNVMHSAIGDEHAWHGTSNTCNFLLIGNIPNNVYIER